LAFKIEKVKTKYKNSALCLSEKLALFTRYVSYTNTLPASTKKMNKKYSKQVEALFKYKIAKLKEEWINYPEKFNFDATHIPELIDVLKKTDLESVTMQKVENSAPMHAWRALGQLNATESVKFLFESLIKNSEAIIFYLELPVVIGMMDENAIEPTKEYLEMEHNDRLDIKLCAIESLTKLANHITASKNRIATIFIESLNEYSFNNYKFTTYLIKALMELEITKANELIEEIIDVEEYDSEIISYDEVRMFLNSKK
jgi:hypothetical protein